MLSPRRRKHYQCVSWYCFGTQVKKQRKHTRGVHTNNIPMYSLHCTMVQIPNYHKSCHNQQVTRDCTTSHYCMLHSWNYISSSTPRHMLRAERCASLSLSLSLSELNKTSTTHHSVTRWAAAVFHEIRWTATITEQTLNVRKPTDHSSSCSVFSASCRSRKPCLATWCWTYYKKQGAQLCLMIWAR